MSRTRISILLRYGVYARLTSIHVHLVMLTAELLPPPPPHHTHNHYDLARSLALQSRTGPYYIRAIHVYNCIEVTCIFPSKDFMTNKRFSSADIYASDVQRKCFCELSRACQFFFFNFTLTFSFVKTPFLIVQKLNVNSRSRAGVDEMFNYPFTC